MLPLVPKGTHKDTQICSWRCRLTSRHVSFKTGTGQGTQSPIDVAGLVMLWCKSAVHNAPNPEGQSRSGHTCAHTHMYRSKKGKRDDTCFSSYGPGNQNQDNNEPRHMIKPGGCDESATPPLDHYCADSEWRHQLNGSTCIQDIDASLLYRRRKWRRVIHL